MTGFATVLTLVLARFGVELTPEDQILIVSIGIAIGQYLSKDHNVTGGTKKQ